MVLAAVLARKGVTEAGTPADAGTAGFIGE
jgi:hypothetical protein